MWISQKHFQEISVDGKQKNTERKTIPESTGFSRESFEVWTHVPATRWAQPCPQGLLQFSKCDKIFKIFCIYCTTWPSLDQGVLLTSHHFENRAWEGLGTKLRMSIKCLTKLISRNFQTTLVEQHFSGFLEKRTTLRGKPKFLTGNFRSISLDSWNCLNSSVKWFVFQEISATLFLLRSFRTFLLTGNRPRSREEYPNKILKIYCRGMVHKHLNAVKN